MANEFMRYEVNQRAKAILSKHAADLTLLNFSFSGMVLYLYGKLVRQSNDDFSPAQIESLTKELSALPGVKDLEFDLENWNIFSDFNTWRAMPKKKFSLADSGPGRTLVIKGEEQIADTLKEMKEKSKEEDSDFAPGKGKN